MYFALLGPISVTHEGRALELSGLMPRSLLAALLFRPNVIVPMDDLVEAIWGHSPPQTAAASLQNHVMRLRRMIGDEAGERIRVVPPGYLIRVESGELDSETFTRLCADGRRAARAGQWETSAECLAAALALWRGRPAADATGLYGHEAAIQRLLEARTQATEGRIDAALHLGRHREVISELRALAASHPLAENFHGQLMLALYRAGRQAEALEVFHRLRRTLVEELAVEPSRHIQDIHCAVLRADPSLADPSAAIPAAGDAKPSPVADPLAHGAHGGSRFQLPADTRAFTGREAELEHLIALARAGSRGGDTGPNSNDAGLVVIHAIDGMAGIGKSALAVHAAHRVREDFPDGQLFLDLHGHTPGTDPVSPADALGWLLRSLGTPPQLIPQDLAQRSAYYRNRLNGTRTLIILDNAASTAQVRPLLPGAPGCLVMVTSRKRLTGLDEAHSLALDVLPQADASALFHQIAGPGRVPADHPAVPELTALCGNLPLAVRILAARLRHRRALPVEDLVRVLRDDGSRLGLLQDDDRNLTAVFESSYAALPAAEQRMFRVLGQVPGPDFDDYAAACLADTDRATAERLLQTLLDHNLLAQYVPGRYQFHDLVRLYARSLTLAGAGPSEEGDAALERLLDYYQFTTHAADHFLARHDRSATAASPIRPVAVPDLPDQSHALAWLRAERRNLLAAVAWTGESGQPVRLIALTADLAAFLQQEGPWPTADALQHAAVDAAHAIGDRRGEANALCELGCVMQLNVDFAGGAKLQVQALAIFQELGDRLGEANALCDVGRAQYPVGQYAAASEMLEQALAIYQELDCLHGQGNTFFDLGRVRYSTGHVHAAIELHDQSVAIRRRLGDRLGEADALSEIGRVRLVIGDISGASAPLEQALATFRELGSRLGTAETLRNIARMRQLTGDFSAAAGLMEEAHSIYESLGHRYGMGYALFGMGQAEVSAGDLVGAADHLEQALAIFLGLDHRHGEANALQDLGRLRLAAGDLSAAADLLERSLKAFQDVSDPQGEAEVLTITGALLARTDGPDQALAAYRRALDLAAPIPSPVDEARALEGIGRCMLELGDRAEALTSLRQAVALYQRIQDPGADAAAAFLAELENQGTS
jgi:DNA-binding SARP family transcriptional activator/tetratricopeptide (TPR) repeat protein